MTSSSSTARSTGPSSLAGWAWASSDREAEGGVLSSVAPSSVSVSGSGGSGSTAAVPSSGGEEEGEEVKVEVSSSTGAAPSSLRTVLVEGGRDGSTEVVAGVGAVAVAVAGVVVAVVLGARRVLAGCMSMMGLLPPLKRFWRASMAAV